MENLLLIVSSNILQLAKEEIEINTSLTKKELKKLITNEFLKDRNQNLHDVLVILNKQYPDKITFEITSYISDIVEEERTKDEINIEFSKIEE